MSKFLPGALFVILSIVVLVPSSEATLANQTAFKQAYPNAKSVSCKTCHQSAIGKGGDLNPYGMELQKLKGPGKAKNLTAQDFKEMKTPTNPGGS